MKVMLSIIIPALNEAQQIIDTLAPLQLLRAQGVELILVDGGSHDDTVILAEPMVDLVLFSAKGRARQMNAGAVRARGEVFIFLHADTRLTSTGVTAVLSATAGKKEAWGRFDVHLIGRPWLLKVIAYLINLRSRFSAISTGDQAQFFTRDLFYRVGKFPDQPLMEDVEISRRAKATCAPINLRHRVESSARRWELYGIWRTIWLMWQLRYRYWRGTPAAILAQRYR